MALKCIIHLENRVDDITTLVIKMDDSTRGYFLFLYSSMDKHCEWDFWFEHQEEAMSQVDFMYGPVILKWEEISDTSIRDS